VREPRIKQAPRPIVNYRLQIKALRWAVSAESARRYGGPASLLSIACSTADDIYSMNF